MARGKAGAVAQQAMAQQQANVSKQESLELVQCLLRVSIMQVCYLRQLFGDAYFNELHMDQLDGMTIKTLKPIDDEASRLVDWVEQGVADALKLGYIKHLFFGISSDITGENLLEEYIYTFSYGEDGKACLEFTTKSHGKQVNKMDLTSKAPGKSKPQKPASVDTVRYEVCRLIRMLVEISQTLDKVPSERYLFMKMTYHDHTPQEYEPPMFQPMEQERLSRFRSNPFRMFVGDVNTQHHSVRLSVKSILDACGDADSEGYAEDEEEMEGSHMVEGSQPGADSMHMDEQDDAGQGARGQGMQGQGAAVQAAVQIGAVQLSVPKAGDNGLTQELMRQQAKEDMQMLMMTEAQPLDDSPCPQASNDETQLNAGAHAPMPADMEAEQQLPTSQPRSVSEALPSQQRHEVLAGLSEFCAKRRLLDLDDVCLAFPHAPMALLEGALQGLVDEGLLKAGPKAGEYLVVPASKRATAKEGLLAMQLTGLTVSGAAAKSGAAGAGVAPLSLKGLADGSIMGRMQSTHAGSELTLKPTTPAVTGQALAATAAADAMVDDDDAEDAVPPPTSVYFECSQQSHAAAAHGSVRLRPRKASYVTAPIHQSMKKKAATPSKGRVTRTYTRSAAGSRAG